jgi:hypothetical protein
MPKPVELWRSSRTFQLMSRASYFGPIFGLSTAYDWAALVALRMPRGTDLALRITTTIAIMD